MRAGLIMDSHNVKNKLHIYISDGQIRMQGTIPQFFFHTFTWNSWFIVLHEY